MLAGAAPTRPVAVSLASPKHFTRQRRNHRGAVQRMDLRDEPELDGEAPPGCSSYAPGSNFLALRSIMNRTLALAALLLAPVLLGSSRTAWAGIEACGDIHVEAEAQCQIEVEGGCELQCTPLSVEAACAGELQLECRGECNASAEAECQASCDVASCVAQCEVDPPRFQCTADCNARAEAACDAQCAASSTRGECTASCKATYSAECDADCEGTPPSASCEARCEASCEGSCRASANVDCQVACQSNGYLECKTRLEGGCEAACQRPEGALFCDGQYVDAGNNLEECVAALQAALDIEVDATATASGSCAEGRCEGSAEGSASASCAVVPSSDAPAGSMSGAALATLVGWAALALARRRR